MQFVYGCAVKNNGSTICAHGRKDGELLLSLRFFSSQIFKHFVSFKHEFGQTLRSLWVFEIFFFLHQPYSLISLHVHVCFFPMYLTGIVAVRSLQLHNSFLQIVGHESATNNSSLPRIFSLHFAACFVRKYAE